MKKYNFIATAIFLISGILNANASSVGLPVLVCNSLEKVEGWDYGGTDDFVQYTAFVESETSLLKAQISGAYTSDSRDLTADADPTNKYSRLRFQALEDAWKWFNLLLPKDFLSFNKEFEGSIQFYTEDSSTPEYIDMSCSVKK